MNLRKLFFGEEVRSWRRIISGFVAAIVLFTALPFASGVYATGYGESDEDDYSERDIHGDSYGGSGWGSAVGRMGVSLTTFGNTPTWTLAYRMVDSAGIELTEYNPGTAARLQVRFSFTNFNESMLDTEFELNLLKSFFTLPNGTDLKFANPEVNGIKVFDPSSLNTKTDVQINNVDYYRFTIKFSDDQDLVAAIANERLLKLDMDIFVKFNSTLTSWESDKPPVVVESGASFTFTGLPQKPIPVVPDDGSPSGEKRLFAAYRPTSLGASNYIKASGQETMASKKYIPKEGDIVIFRIRVQNPSSSTSNVLVNEIRDKLPLIYDYLDFDTSITLSGGSAQELHSAAGITMNYVWDSEGDDGAVKTYKYNPVDSSDVDFPLLLKPGGQKDVYIAAKVKSLDAIKSAMDPGQETIDKMSNYAEVTVPLGSSGIGPWSPLSPKTDPEYDMAIRTQVRTAYTETKDANGAIVSVNSLASNYTGHLEIWPGDTIRVELLVSNQGNAIVKDPEITLYVPKGFTLVTKYDIDSTRYDYYKDNVSVSNKLFDWTAGSQIANVGSQWSNLETYTCKPTTSPIASGSDLDFYVFLTADAMDLDSPTPTMNARDYYVGAQITDFHDYENADKHIKGTSTNKIEDVDSFIPYATPFGDTGFLRDTAINSTGTERKEIQNERDKKAKNSTQTTVQSAINDEDCFDFVYVTKRADNAGEPVVDNALDKKRLKQTTDDAIKELKKIFGDNNYNDNFTTYFPVAANGALYDPSSFLIYELWINEEGVEDTEGSTFVDELPLELDFLHCGSSAPFVYGVDIYRYEAIKRSVEGKLVHNVAGYYRERRLGINTSTKTGTNKTSNFKNYADSDGSEKAGTYGVTANITDNKLTIEFEKITSTSATNKDTNVAYKVLVALRISDIMANDITDGKTFQTENKATYTYFGESEIVAVEGTDVTWDLSSGTALIKKYVKGSDGEYKGITGFVNQIEHMTGHNLTLNYRVRVRTTSDRPPVSTGAIDAIDETDTISDTWFDSFGSIITVKGYQGTGFNPDGTLTGPNTDVELSTPAIKAVSDNAAKTLRIYNDALMPANTSYNVDFSVNYKDVPYGALIANTVGTTVRSLVPLQLTVVKQDTDLNLITIPYKFTLYPDANGSPGTEPVKDINELPIVFDESSANSIFYFVPDDFVDKTMAGAKDGEWKFWLVETQAPAGYIGRDPILITVNYSAAAKLLTIASADTGETGYKITSDDNNYNATTAYVRNAKELPDEPGPVGLTIEKRAADSPNALLSGYEFALCYDSNGTLPVKDKNNRSIVFKNEDGYRTFSFVPESLVAETKLWLVETAAPAGYIKGEPIPVIVKYDATTNKLTILPGEKAGSYKITFDGNTATATAVIYNEEDKTVEPGEPGEPGEPEDPKEPGVGPLIPVGPGGGGGSGGGSSGGGGGYGTGGGGGTFDPTGGGGGGGGRNPNSDSSFTTIGDSPVPLATMPELATILDDMVPLGFLPQTGSTGRYLMWGMCAAGLLAGAGIIAKRKGKDESKDESKD